MMTRTMALARRRPVAAAALALLAVAGFLALPQITRSAGEPKFQIDPLSQNAPVSQSEVTATVKIENASNVGAWEFRLAWRADVLTFKSVTPSGFLTSTGRVQECPSATKNTGVVITDETGVWDTLQFGCATGGSSLAAVSGDGTLATLTFTVKAAGTTPLLFTTNGELADALGLGIPVPTAPGDGVVKIAAPGSGDQNSVEPTPRSNPRRRTPTPIPNAPTHTPQYNLKTPESQVDSTAPGAPGSSGDTGTTGPTGTTSAAQGSTTAPGSSAGTGGSSGGTGLVDRVQAAGNFPIAGYGMAQDAVSRLSLWAQLLLLAGVIAIGAGAAMRTRRFRR